LHRLHCVSDCESGSPDGTSDDATLIPNELIRQADDKLFQAKQDGRNRVVA
jgi:PleD family two-component response regulator